MQLPKHDWRGDNKIATWRKVFAGRGTLSILYLFENAFACRQVSSARVRQCELACRSDEKARAEVSFQFCQLATHRRQWNPKIAACARKASGFGYGDKDRHVVKSIHHSSE